MKTSKLIYDAAAKFIGLAEIPGEKSNPAIVQFINEAATWLDDGVKDVDGSIAWCGCFRGHIGILTGTGVPRSHYRANSWSTWGAAVPLKTSEWQLGDTVVLKRKGGHHVALFHSYDVGTGKLTLLGGNQGDKVCLAKFSLNDVVSVRRLV